MQTKERKIMKKPWTEIILTYNSLRFDHEVEFSAQCICPVHLPMCILNRVIKKQVLQNS